MHEMFLVGIAVELKVLLSSQSKHIHAKPDNLQLFPDHSTPATFSLFEDNPHHGLVDRRSYDVVVGYLNHLMPDDVCVVEPESCESARCQTNVIAHAIIIEAFDFQNPALRGGKEYWQYYLRSTAFATNGPGDSGRTSLVCIACHVEEFLEVGQGSSSKLLVPRAKKLIQTANLVQRYRQSVYTSDASISKLLHYLLRHTR
mmetsp:Transcript_68832/g.128465  ORF Transcript_68832/g.128465 Transcript_68832/m.128465 type:complete len:201 (-) Transcript_68832:381-983(-)